MLVKILSYIVEKVFSQFFLSIAPFQEAPLSAVLHLNQTEKRFRLSFIQRPTNYRQHSKGLVRGERLLVALGKLLS